jgi:DNA repair exonuclease SbcCD ATPase subunit
MVCNKCNSRGDSYCEYCRRYTGLCSNCYESHHQCREKHDASVRQEAESNIKVEHDYSASIEKLTDTFAIEMLQRRNNELSQQLEQLDEMYEKIKATYEESIADLQQKLTEATERISELTKRDVVENHDAHSPLRNACSADTTPDATPKIGTDAITERIDDNLKKIKTIKKKIKAANTADKFDRLSKGKSTKRLNNIQE